MGNLISLTEVSSYRKCQHYQVLVDERRNEVECASCGEMLNPIWVLNRMARKQSVVGMEIETKKKLLEQIEQKKRCKCEHCGKLTKVLR